MNSLFLALTKAGYQPWLNDPQARNIGVTVGSQRISFAPDHPKARAEANKRVQTPREAYEILRLEISANGGSWTDDDGGRIEDQLREIVLKLIVAGEVQYRANTHSAYETVCRRRAEMERMLAEQRAAAARLAREKAVKEEAEQCKSLLRMAADHRDAKDIRAFVDAAMGAFGPNTAKEGPAARWIAWALGVADQIDPVGRLRIVEDGMVTEKPAIAPAADISPDSSGK